MLHVAADSGHAAIIKFLIENGADLKKIDYCKKSAFELAAIRGHTDCVSLLFYAIKKIDPEFF